MDIDATLAQIRNLVVEILDDDNATERERELAELADNLDGWLSRSGFMPSDWES